MPDTRHRRFALSLGPLGAQLALRSGWLRPRYRLLESLVWPAQATDEQRGAALDAMLLQHARSGSALEVLVADLWVPSASVQPPVNSATLADLNAAVSLRLNAVTDSATGWQTASAPRTGGRFVASAMRSSLMDMLRVQCQRHGLHLVSVQPLFAALWNHWHASLEPGQWLGVCGEGVLTLCVAPQRHVEQLRRLDFAPANAQEPLWPVEAAQHEGLRLGLPVPAKLALCGAVPQAWRGASAVYLGPVGDALSLWGVKP